MTQQTRATTYHEIVNHHGATFWIAEHDLDSVFAAYNDELLHPRQHWLKRTGRTKVE